MFFKQYLPTLLLIAALIGLVPLSYRNVQQAIVVAEKDVQESGLALEEEESLVVNNIRYDGYEKYAYIQEAFKRGQVDITQPPRFPLYKSGYLKRELDEARRNAAAYRTKSTATFAERGPSNIPGRTRSIVIDATDPSENTWYAGAVGGGIWKTNNAGDSWTELTSSLPNLAISSMAQSSANPSILYAGTGEKIFAGIGGGNGNGLLKSSDSGQTWEYLPGTTGPEFENIGRVIVDPMNEDVLLITTTENKYFRTEETDNYIFRSTDGGASWIEVYTSEFFIPQIIADPKDWDVQYATLYNGSVIKSTDGGQTWSLPIVVSKSILDSETGIFNLLESPNIGRIELAIAPQNTNIIYASLDTGESDLYISLDGGENWSQAYEPNPGRSIDWLGGQGDWDNTILVSPLNDSIVYLGGVAMESFKMGSSIETDLARTIDVAIENADEIIEIWNLFADEGTDIEPSEFVSVEIRYGLTQRAHRFTVPEGSTSGVPAEDYTYQDFVDVPFQVWDVDNNQQLAVSFRDNNDNGIYDLNDDFNSSREYIFVNNIPYDLAANEDIGQNGGYQYRNSFLLWLITPEDVVWDESLLTDVRIRLELTEEEITKIEGVYTQVANPYEFSRGSYVGPNDLFEFHPDHHQLYAINISENDFQILNTNDGGVWVSDVANLPGVTDGSWTLASTGYNTTTYYGADKSPIANRYVAGAQDQGTHISPIGQSANASTAYDLAFFGDGFEVIWHSEDAGRIIGASQFNGIQRSINAGLSFNDATNGLEKDGPFVSRLSNSPLEPDLLFAIGAAGVYRSANFGGVWSYSRIEDERWSFWSAADVEVSLADPAIVWAGGAMVEGNDPGNVFLSQDGGFTFEATNNFGDVGLVTGLYSHPYDRGTAFALFGVADGPKIVKTTDFGETWTDITQFVDGESQNGFPDISTYSLLVMPHDTSMIWAGTEIGIVESLDGGATWNLLNEPDFRSVSVWDMKVKGDQIVIATHGRGVWTATIPDLLETEPPSVVLSPVLNGLRQSLSAFELVADIELRDIYDEINIILDGEIVKNLSGNEATGSILESIVIDQEGVYAVRIQAIKDDRILQSEELQIVVSPFFPVQDTYINRFSEPTEEFALNQFSIGSAPDFISGVLQTVHPYPEASSLGEPTLNLTAVLNVPIRIAESKANITFREVVIVEEGERFASFGQTSFFDFVIVEGSVNRTDWIPLLDGYDASDHEDWSEAYAAGESGRGMLFKRRNIDLLDTFEPGEIVQIRFRLFSDARTNAWGWAIDDLSIQADEVVGVPNDPDVFSKVSLFPNPSFGTVNLTIENVLRGSIDMRVIDLAGKQFMTQSLYNQTGKLEQQLNLSTLPFGIYVLELNNGQDIVTKKILKF